MREILFRGKQVDNGEWVQGTYYHQKEFYDDETDIHYIIESCNQLEDNMMDFSVVIPETVGQYTGLTDKNGKKIFEGDIVKIKGKTRYIFYGSSSFRHTNYGEYAAELTNVNTDRDCEVIGNIHDNPELLERSKG